jgi:plastocyanin
MESEQPRPSGFFIALVIIIALAIPLLVAVTLVSGLGSSGSSSVQNGVTVTIPLGVASNQSLNYVPSTITVVVGVNNTIVWTQNDPIPHTVTSVQVPGGVDSFDSGPLNKGDTFTVTLNVPGTYLYHCSYHGWMKGTIIVKSG